MEEGIGRGGGADEPPAPGMRRSDGARLEEVVAVRVVQASPWQQERWELHHPLAEVAAEEEKATLLQPLLAVRLQRRVSILLA